MRLRGVLLLSFLGLGSLTLARGTAHSPSPAVAEASAAADRFYKAFLAGDVGEVSQMTAENFVQTDVNGHVQDKTAWLEEYYRPLAKGIAAGHGYQVFERQVEETREVGNVVVMVGTMRLQQGDSSTGPRTLRFTQVWARHDGSWQRAVVHNAWVPEPSSGAEVK